MSGDAKELLTNPACLRSGLMWGIGMGVLIGAHRFRVSGNVQKACDWAVVTFMGISGGTWALCRAEYSYRLQQTREFMDVMNNPQRKLEAEQFLRSRVQVEGETDSQSTASSQTQRAASEQ